jgi:Flp pilus assembly protein TadD/endogenous inhibitor of DNA gyrase (YacG/DUF329 family)
MLDDLFELKCPDCGKSIKENESHCPHCGADLDASDVAEGAESIKASREYFESAQWDYDNDTNLREALANCDLAIQYDPNFAEAHNLRGLILDELGEPKLAVAAYRKALKLNPALEDARANLEDAKEEYGEDIIDAVVEVKATEQNTKDGNTATTENLIQNAQRLYDNGENLSFALSTVKLALEKEPNSAEALNLRGLILDAMERTDEAIASYREALKIDPTFKDAADNLRDAEAETRVSEPVHQQYAISNEAMDEGNTNTLIKVIGAVFLVLLCAAGVWFSYQFANIYLLPKTEVILVPDVPSGVTVERADLEKAAQTLTDRSNGLGYSNVTFKASNGEIVGTIPSTIDVDSLLNKIGSTGLLEFVDFGNTPVPAGETITTDLNNKYMGQANGQEWHTVMSNEGIETAAVSKSQVGGYQIAFTLTDAGTKTFAEHTGQNIGTYLGIVLDKVVISAPMIQQPITDGQGVISGTFTQETANDLAVVLQTKPLPFPIKLK